MPDGLRQKGEDMKYNFTGENITYRSDNGYSGVLYGKSSMKIYDPNGIEIMHTYFRAANTLQELKEIVDTMPEFLEKLKLME